MTNDAPLGRGRDARDCAAAFTLIELLTVIAIIGILAAILIPTASAARNAANKAKTRAQFSQWAAAFEAFRQEYGIYPQLHAQRRVNEGASTDARQEHLFHDILAGQRRDPAADNWSSDRADRNPPAAEAQNSRRIRFVSFHEADFVTAADVAAGHNSAAQLNLLRDAFHNTSIAVVTDANHDGVINGRDVGGIFPAVAPPDGGPEIRPTSLLPVGTSGGVHAGVVFYCAPPGATTEHDLIISVR